MKSIKILSYLDIQNGSLVTNRLKRHNSIFLKQGSMDGACGPYCVFMALLILGVINYNQATNLWIVDEDKALGKLVKKMKEHKTLFQDGTHLHELEGLLKNSFKEKLSISANTNRGKDIIQFTIEKLNENQPVIVGVVGKNLAHWLLAVGYEQSEEDEGVKLLFLDPSGEDNSKYWNATIDVKNTYYGYPYQWVDQVDTFIKIEDALSIGLK